MTAAFIATTDAVHTLLGGVLRLSCDEAAIADYGRLREECRRRARDNPAAFGMYA